MRSTSPAAGADEKNTAGGDGGDGGGSVGAAKHAAASKPAAAGSEDWRSKAWAMAGGAPALASAEPLHETNGEVVEGQPVRTAEGADNSANLLSRYKA